jgi:putative phosphoribosyl transferase
MFAREARPRVLEDRAEAGRLLARVLRRYRSERPIVVALPRGGVPVGHEIARELGAPLDVLIVRKIGAPGFPEYGLGALAEPDLIRLDEARARAEGFHAEDLAPVIAREREELRRRARVYRGDRAAFPVEGRCVILVDDGMATGGTMRVAASALRARRASFIVVAVGVASPEAVDALKAEVDRVVVVSAPRGLGAIGAWYRSFEPVEDDEVVNLLRLSNRRALDPTS